MNETTTTNTLEPINNKRVYLNKNRTREIRRNTFRRILDRRIAEIVVLGE